MAKGNPSIQHTPKAKLRFDFLLGVANAQLRTNGKVFPPPHHRLPFPGRYMRAMHSKSKPKTWLYYRNGVRRISAFGQLASLLLDEPRIAERIPAYVAHRQSKELLVSSINRELQVLRRMMRLGCEWGLIEHAPKVKLLNGERHREFVLSLEEEAKYLAAAHEPLASVAILGTSKISSKMNRKASGS